MNPKLKSFIITFFMTGLPFGIIMEGYDLLAGNGFHLKSLLFLTCFFGFFMAITMPLVNVSIGERWTKKKNVH